MIRARMFLLLGATLGLSSLLMEWAAYANSFPGGHAFVFIAPVSLKGTDYYQWPFVLLLAAVIGASALTLAVAPRTMAVATCLVASILLLGTGVWLYVGSTERAYERAFLVVANNIADATDYERDIEPGHISDLERGYFIERQEQMKHIDLSPGMHGPVVAGVLSLIGAILLWRRTRTSSPSQQHDVEHGESFAVAACGALLAGVSVLMVWGHHQASWPVESAIILMDHPSFTGVDLLQWPFVVGLSAVVGIGAVLAGGGWSNAALWLLRAAATGLILLGVSIFFTAATDSFDEPGVMPRGASDELVTLSSLEEGQTDLGGEELFTDKGRFKFEIGSLGSVLGGVVILIATFSPDLRRRAGRQPINDSGAAI